MKTTNPIMYKQITQELSIKFKRTEVERRKITSSREAADFFRMIYDADMIEWAEIFMIVLLNNANRTVHFAKISTGTANSTIVCLKTIATMAINTNASAVLICHNHPSGSKQPSDADRALTKKIQEALGLFDIKVLDHIILTADGYLSFQDEGFME